METLKILTQRATFLFALIFQTILNNFVLYNFYWSLYLMRSLKDCLVFYSHGLVSTWSSLFLSHLLCSRVQVTKNNLIYVLQKYFWGLSIYKLNEDFMIFDIKMIKRSPHYFKTTFFNGFFDGTQLFLCFLLVVLIS